MPWCEMKGIFSSIQDCFRIPLTCFAFCSNPASYLKMKCVSTFSVFITERRHLEVFCKKGVFRNFTKFTGKHQCQSLFFNKVAGLRPHTCFPVNFVKFLRTSFFIEHLWWLLLLISNS